MNSNWPAEFDLRTDRLKAKVGFQASLSRCAGTGQALNFVQNEEIHWMLIRPSTRAESTPDQNYSLSTRPLRTLTPSVLLLEARVGIGRFKRRFRGKYTHFHWLHKRTLSLQESALSLHLC